jgi:hypothetical protein
MLPKPLKSFLQIGILLLTLAVWIIRTGFHEPLVVVGYTVCGCWYCCEHVGRERFEIRKG